VGVEAVGAVKVCMRRFENACREWLPEVFGDLQGLLHDGDVSRVVPDFDRVQHAVRGILEDLPHWQCAPVEVQQRLTASVLAGLVLGAALQWRGMVRWPADAVPGEER
jgi:hypothetical protein